MFDIDLTGWAALDDEAARRRADRIAATVEAELVGLRWHEYHGRRMRQAMFQRGGTTFALVPGGEVQVGYDMDRFAPSAEMAKQYEQYLAVVPDRTAEPALPDLIARYTTRRRTVTIPPLLVATKPVESGVVPCPPDDPRIVELMARWPAPPNPEEYAPIREIEVYRRARMVVRRDNTVLEAWLIDPVPYDRIVADLAAVGERLPTPGEWEYACGAGVETLWRWGSDCPYEGIPYPDQDGPHREPNLWGLSIVENPYWYERTAVPEVCCGGDGGTALHHEDFGQVGAWLTVATSYRNEQFNRYVAEREKPSTSWIRPVIALEG